MLQQWAAFDVIMTLCMFLYWFKTKYTYKKKQILLLEEEKVLDKETLKREIAKKDT